MFRLTRDLSLVARKKIFADLYSTRDRVCRRLVNDHADPAKVDVAVVGDDLQRRRGDIDGHVLLKHRVVAAKEIPQRIIAGTDPQHRRTFLQAGEFRR